MTIATLVEKLAPKKAETKDVGPDREKLELTPTEVAALERGVDYTGKLEISGRSTILTWHRDRPGEVARAQSVVDATRKAGTTIFDLSGGTQHAGRVTTLSPDTEELVGVAPLVGG